MALAEFELIKRYFATPELAFAREGVVLGPGDDCALLELAPGHQLAVSIDTLNEGVHFPPDAQPYDLAQRCLRVNLSDLAAMGAEPLGFTLALSLPHTDETWLQNFSAGLAACAQAFNCSLIGGDTTKGPLAITIQVHGQVPAAQALRRDGASAGDAIYVTGPLGDAALALPYLIGDAELMTGLDADAQAWLRAAFYRPEARVTAGMALRGLASAAIDISDGLASDLRHILQASGVAGAILETENLPMSALLRRLVSSPQRLALALAGGDDYELCVTVGRRNEAQACRVMQEIGIAFTCIGELTMEPGLFLRDKGGALSSLELQGYRHFGGE